MIRAFWSWLTRRPDRREAAPPPEPAYNPKTDPLVRRFKAERLQAERNVHRIQRRRRRDMTEYLRREGRHE